MVANGTRDRCSSSSTSVANTSTTDRQRRVSSTNHDKKKIAKPIGICGFCLGDNTKNANDAREEMINCAECGNSGHPSCLQYSERLVEKIRTIHWQCIDCKRCIVCNKSDDSLLFCDFCDSGIHPKCCNPPLNTIPKGDFACHLCHDEIPLSPKKTLSSSSTSSIRSRHSNLSNNDETSPIISRPVAQLIDGMSNFFLPNKQKTNNIRQQSVQKAMKYLRDKKTIKSSDKKLVKRLHSPTFKMKSSKENKDLKNQLLAKTILASSKTPRIRKKLLHEDSSSNPQTSTPLLPRQLSNKKLLTIEPTTPPPRGLRQSDIRPIETNLSQSVTKQKHLTNLISPISSTSSIIKKRSRNDSPPKKSHSKSKKRKEIHTDNEQTDDDDENSRKSKVPKQQLNLNLSKYKNPPAFLNDSLPDNITENDIYLFLESRTNSTKLITDCSDKFHHSSESIDDDTTNTRWPPYIVFGSDLLKTWYSSSYPQEYARVPRLYICEFCLKYMKCEQMYDRHRKKCLIFHPPANEIYHKDDLSVFEVDGNSNRIYCQNLCLLAKLFLDHKTLYYDVEPFLFYVLTKNDVNGCHFLGYFSKEKHCPQKYNLSCITVLPNCQRRGYGRFLIELSYLISQKEGQVGTPERPLSTLGAQTYEAYWKIKIVEQLLIYSNENHSKCLIKSIMNETAMATDDIIEALQNLGVLTMKTNGKPVITVDVTQIESIMKVEKTKHAHWVAIDSEYLRFTPVLTPLLLTNEEKAVEKEVKEIQIVFKEIGREAAEAASLAAELNPTDGVRYIRRRKFGHKRRSIIVKRRAPVYNKVNKNESLITHDDSCVMDIIANDDDDDEHSQEYKPRRPKTIINEPIIKEEEEEENKMTSKVPSPKLSLKQSTFKQLKLDQFLKVVQPAVTSSVDETLESDPLPLSNSDAKNEDTHLETRRITRTTRLHSTSKSESEPVKIENAVSPDPLNKPDVNHATLLTRQISEGGVSTVSSNDNSTATETSYSSSLSNKDRRFSLKKRALTSSNIQPLIESPLTLSENKIDQPILSRETSVTTTNPPETPSSLSDILVHRFLSTSSSVNDTDDEMKIARIESELKGEEQLLSVNSFETTIKPIESIDDEAPLPPSLTSPTSMIISQSNHYNYPTRSKKQQPITITNFDTSANMNYNFADTSYPYPYPSAPTYDMQPFYYPPTAPLDFMSYYPTSSSPGYPCSGSIYSNTAEQQAYYPSNGMNSMSYNGNGPTPYMYPTAQSSSTAPATGQH